MITDDEIKEFRLKLLAARDAVEAQRDYQARTDDVNDDEWEDYQEQMSRYERAHQALGELLSVPEAAPPPDNDSDIPF